MLSKKETLVQTPTSGSSEGARINAPPLTERHYLFLWVALEAGTASVSVTLAAANISSLNTINILTPADWVFAHSPAIRKGPGSILNREPRVLQLLLTSCVMKPKARDLDFGSRIESRM